MRKLMMRASPCRIPGYPDYLAALLCARGITDSTQAERFLNPEISHLNDPFALSGMEQAVRLIREAGEKGQAVTVYGDYDADGVCASAIVLEALSLMGVSAFPYIPARQTEGYGLNEEAILTLSGQAALLISVDCGITAVQEVRLAKEKGMKVILTDHHTLPETLPPADAIVHPRLGNYPETNLSGAGVAWKLACALIGLDAALDSLELAALATVADLVPLQGENRVIVSLGLKAMGKTRRVGLRALMRVSGIREGSDIQAEHIAYQMAPRLNAGGRLNTALQALNLLVTQDETEAEALAAQMDALNRERRDIEQKVLKEASLQVSKLDLSGLRSLVIAGEGWNPGVVGLTAGKLAERWNYPSIVLTENGEEYSGSGRSAGGIDLHLAISDCAGLCSRFGGHRMAAGLSLPRENLEEFARRFDLAVRQQLGGNDLVPETVYDTALSLKEVSLDTIGRLDALAPFGLGNPAPVFLFENLGLVSFRAVGGGKAHLKLTVAQAGTFREGIAFGQGSSAESLGREVSLVSAVDRNEFNGRVSAQLKVRALLPGQEACAEDPELQARALIASFMAPNDESAAKAGVKAIRSLPALKGTRGTLIVAYTSQTANDLHRLYPDLQVYAGSAPDPRGFHAILYAPDWQGHFGRFDRLVFADGLPNVYTVEMARKATGAREARAMPISGSLAGFLARMTPSVQELRDAYVLLRQGSIAGLTDHPGKDLAALSVFSQLGLAELDENHRFLRLLPMTRIDPQQSALYRALSN